jgi:hypothetical protein
MSKNKTELLDRAPLERTEAGLPRACLVCIRFKSRTYTKEGGGEPRFCARGVGEKQPDSEMAVPSQCNKGLISTNSMGI